MRLVLIAALSAFLFGCAASVDPSTYSIGSVGQVNRSVRGVVVSARPVMINANTGAGGVVGGTAGAVAGSSIGGGARANVLGAIGGAVVGGLLGSSIEARNSLLSGMEYVVSTSNNNLLTITQGNL